MNKEELLAGLRKFNFTAYYFEEIDSTNTYVKKFSLNDGSVVIADYQTAGKGRLNHSWFSDKGKNVLLTIVKKLDVDIYNSYIINFYVSFIVLETLKKFLNESDKLCTKWPNDVLFGEKKIAGVLSEKVNDIFIIGIGINVNQDVFPEELKEKATSIFQVDGREICLNSVIYKLIEEFISNLELIKRPAEVVKVWRKNFRLSGRKVKYLLSGNDERIAMVVGVDDDGGIILDECGIRKKYYSGEISNIRV